MKNAKFKNESFLLSDEILAYNFFYFSFILVYLIIFCFNLIFLHNYLKLNLIFFVFFQNLIFILNNSVFEIHFGLGWIDPRIFHAYPRINEK
jgi:hypothetical protein